MKSLPSGVTIPSSGGASLFACLQVADVDESVTIASGGGENAKFLPCTGDTFVLEGSPEFTLTAEGGIITYEGTDDIQVLCWAAASLENTSADTFSLIYLGISKNGQFINEAPFASAFQALGGCMFPSNQINNGGNRVSQLACTRLLSLVEGDTIQLVGGQDPNFNIVVLTGSLSILKVA